MIFYVLVSFLTPAIMLLVRKLIKHLEFRVGIFERGFDSYNVRVLPISLRFFTLCIIFLVLDLELIIVSLRPVILFFIGFLVRVFIFLLLVTIRVILD
jgi:NADH:ubiquinone oxidoreductase subunit 3 (subunit A)